MYRMRDSEMGILLKWLQSLNITMDCHKEDEYELDQDHHQKDEDEDELQLELEEEEEKHVEEEYLEMEDQKIKIEEMSVCVYMSILKKLYVWKIIPK